MVQPALKITHAQTISQLLYSLKRVPTPYPTQLLVGLEAVAGSAFEIHPTRIRGACSVEGANPQCHAAIAVGGLKCHSVLLL